MNYLNHSLKDDISAQCHAMLGFTVERQKANQEPLCFQA